MAEDWSRAEVDATVADYLDMLGDDLRGLSYSKSASALLERLRELGRGSLDLRITRYEVRDGVDAPFGKIDVVAWIEFEGRACVPR